MTVHDFVDMHGTDFEEYEVAELERIVSDVNALNRMRQPWAHYAREQFYDFFEKRARRRHQQQEWARQPEQHGPSKVQLQLLALLQASCLGQPYSEVQDAWAGGLPI